MHVCVYVCVMDEWIKLVNGYDRIFSMLGQGLFTPMYQIMEKIKYVTQQ